RRTKDTDSGSSPTVTPIGRARPAVCRGSLIDWPKGPDGPFQQANPTSESNTPAKGVAFAGAQLAVQAGSGVPGGKVTVTQSPLPAGPSARLMLAPCPAAMVLTIDSPSPLPGGEVPARR